MLKTGVHLEVVSDIPKPKIETHFDDEYILQEIAVI